jgi:protein TonB
MFDLIAGQSKHLPSHPALPLVISTTLQAMVIGSIVAVPLFFLTDRLPEVPTMMAFVADVPAPPPPPPPPPPAAPARKPPASAHPAPASGQLAPLEAPERIEPQAVSDDTFEEGVEGGVEGGMPGGVVGGVVGGLPEAPPPPPPPPAPRAPVRVGGQIQTPALLRRVEPVYPPFAVNAHLQGVVILEAVVDEDGSVADVKVLRSANGLLDNAALAAVRQWRYSPLLLNGTRVQFVLTVVLSFNITESSE